MPRQVGLLKSSNRMQSNVDDILSAEISNVGGDSHCGHDADRCQNLLVL